MKHGNAKMRNLVFAKSYFLLIENGRRLLLGGSAAT
jgi:hypothetical protein